MLKFLTKRRHGKKAPKQKVAILGGSFDPVHKGHIQIIRHLLEKFDRVLVVPAKISPFKLGRETAAANDRLSMLKLATDDAACAEIIDYELKSGGISYSYLTARKLSDEKSELSFVIGSEMLSGLARWKNFSELVRLVGFYVIKREGFEITEQLRAEYARTGARITISDLTVPDISSTLVKVAIALERADEYLDTRVLDYIKRYNLYQDYRYITDRYAEFGMKQERIEHTYRAVREGVRLAKIHGADVDSVVTALLLHDIGKYVSAKELAKKYGINIKIDDDIPAACKHAPIGAEIARHCFKIDDEQIISAIATHTTGAPFMDDLAKIVAIADYIEEGRDFSGLTAIREAASRDLDQCMELMLKNTIDYLKGKDTYKKTYDTYDYFRMLNATKHKQD